MAMAARPFVTANFAVTADGRISTRKRTPSDFSTKGDKRRLLEIRAGCDAILVGARTLGTDTMSMGLPAADLKEERVKRGKPPHPWRVIVSSSGKISPELRVFNTPKLPTPIVFTTRAMPVRTISALAPLCDLYLHLSPKVNLRAMLLSLQEDYGVKRVVCEGGGTLLRALLLDDLVDEMHVTFCPRVFGGRKAPTMTGVAGEFLPKSVLLKLAHFEVVGAECFTRWRVQRQKA
jgi:2,5-diamino-6-(ribosylamino)-4(3H)-pyrimidinone 5'-phosphate reductase